VNETIIASGPENLPIERRLSDGEYDARVFDTDVVGREPARDLLLGFVVAREIGRDRMPCHATVRAHVHVLTADIDAVVIVCAQRKRRVPNETVSRAVGRRARDVLWPHLDHVRDIVA
jgi:hypothetical protein